MITEKVKPVLVFFKNKYIIVSIAFAVWMLFIDTKDIGFMLSNSRKLRDLKKSEVALQKDIKDTKKELSLLKTDASSIEKYAREKFYMKKDNEDLFVTDTK
jgi:cell division protein DivIC